MLVTGDRGNDVKSLIPKIGKSPIRDHITGGQVKAYRGPDYKEGQGRWKVNGGCGTTKTNVRR